MTALQAKLLLRIFFNNLTNWKRTDIKAQQKLVRWMTPTQKLKLAATEARKPRNRDVKGKSQISSPKPQLCITRFE